MVPPSPVAVKVVDESQYISLKTQELLPGDECLLPADCQKITLGLGWTCKEGRAIDLDASVLVMRDTDGDGVQDVVDCIWAKRKDRLTIGSNLVIQHMGDSTRQV